MSDVRQCQARGGVRRAVSDTEEEADGRCLTPPYGWGVAEDPEGVCCQGGAQQGPLCA
ncbi:MAG: hypothetical protein LBK25_06220 [Treponema sp.]|nr:hypothetical protein [Treponema sp.]